jgi:hypothetical protein
VVTGRLLVTVAGPLVGVVVLRLVAGVWITAAVLAGLAVVGLVAGWAVVERRVFPRRPAAPASVVVGRGPGDDPGHLVVARALAVAATLLAECERDERQETGR